MCPLTFQLVRSQRVYHRILEISKSCALVQSRTVPSPFRGDVLPLHHTFLFPRTFATVQSGYGESNSDLNIGSVGHYLYAISACLRVSITRTPWVIALSGGQFLRIHQTCQHRDLNSVFSGFNRVHIHTCSTGIDVD